MVIESIRTQLEKDHPLKSTLDRPEVIDALRHGNIYEVLKTSGVNRRDIEDYLATQSRIYQNQIRQEYEVYSTYASAREPDLQKDFAVHSKEMHLNAEEHQLFKQEMHEMRASTNGSTAPGQDVAALSKKALEHWNESFAKIQEKLEEMQRMGVYNAKAAELDRETRRIISLVMSGQIDPEYILIAAAKSSVLRDGTIFSWKGQKIMKLNEEMDKASKTLLKMNPNDKGYVAELQKTQANTRSGGTQLQLEMLDLQKASNQIATTCDQTTTGIKTMQQGRQGIIQAITAR